MQGTDLQASVRWSSCCTLIWYERQFLYNISSLCHPTRPLPYPVLPSPTLCSTPQSGSSGMWWPWTGQSPAFTATSSHSESQRLGALDHRVGWLGVTWVHPVLACPVRHLGLLLTNTWLSAIPSGTHLCLLHQTLSYFVENCSKKLSGWNLRVLHKSIQLRLWGQQLW